MDTFKNEFVEMMVEDGILHVKYICRKIDLKIAKSIVASRLSFTGGLAMPGLADTRKVVSVTREAREYLSSPEATSGVVAAAVISDSAFSTLVANFFMRITKVPMPTKLFTSQKAALDWLQKYKTHR
jgi:hypothetical protein